MAPLIHFQHGEASQTAGLYGSSSIWYQNTAKFWGIIITVIVLIVIIWAIASHL